MKEDGKTIRILIVDDNKATIDNVTRLLSFESDLEVIASARNGREGVELAAEVKPDIVLMDINMPDMDGIEACQRIGQVSPASRVMMMSVQGDMAYFKRAMNAGAREFLTKPFDFDDLIATVRRVYQADPLPGEITSGAKSTAPTNGKGLDHSQPETRGVLISVFGPKGGVGCSTIAASMAVALHKKRQADVLLVDGDILFGDMGALLDLQPKHHIVDILKSDPEDMDLVKQMQADHDSGIHLLAAPPSPELAELVPVEAYLTLLKSLREVHDYIVIDLGTVHSDMVRRVLDLSDRIILVINPDVMSIKNLHLFLSMGDYRYYSFKKVVPVLNRFDPAWGITPEAIGRAIGRPITMVIPDDEQAALMAVNRGKPVLLSAPHSPMSRELLSLVKDMPDRDQLAVELAGGVPLPRVETSQPDSYEFNQEEALEPTLTGRIVQKLSELLDRFHLSRWIQFPGSQL